MRNRILAGLGVAALATVGVAAPATALSPTQADLWLVHAFPGLTVDIMIDGPGSADQMLPGVTPETVAPLVNLPAGDYTVTVFEAGTSTVAIGPATINLAANTSYSAVAHPNASGTPTLTRFTNDLSPIAAGETRVVVRHTAEAPAVDVLAGTNELFTGVTSGQQGGVDVPAGTYPISVEVSPSGPVAIGPANLTFAAGTAYFVHAFGADLDLPYGVVSFPISGLGESPAGVPAGSAGLAAENGVNGGLVAGLGALLLGLIAAGTVIARRVSASAAR
ncbi:DUF4397 domain-containing protein [Microcella sp.]|uniref:DUF4397 domain-containing protein n=1 Tax=Microcella sp. TaxID=1913979 RepID=UPI003F7151E1